MQRTHDLGCLSSFDYDWISFINLMLHQKARPFLLLIAMYFSGKKWPRFKVQKQGWLILDARTACHYQHSHPI